MFAIVAVFVIALCGVFSKQALAEIAVSAFSVVMLMYLVEGRRTGCFCGVAYCAFYAAVCYTKGFYGLMAFNLIFALPMYILSLFTWKKHKHKNTVAVRKLQKKQLALVLAAALAGFGLAYLILKAAGSFNAFFDGLTLSLAAFGTLLLALRYVEQWYFNLAANLASLMLWIAAAVADASNLNFVICTSVFVVSNIMALVSWHKMEHLQKNPTKTSDV